MTAGRKKKVIIGILMALCMTVTGCTGSVKKGTKYLEEKEKEIDRLTTILEGVRYQIPAREIREMILIL